MTSPTRRAITLILTACLLPALSVLAGCAGSPPLEQLVLSPPQTAPAAARPSNWQVQRVQVPEYLDNYEVQLRTQDFVISQLPDAKWAERLPVAITHLLQRTIDAKLQSARSQPYRVTVMIQNFEPQPAGGVLLAARWRILDRRTDAVIARDNTLIRQPLATGVGGTQALEPAAVGQAMSQAVRELGARIAAAAG